jgi:predicted CopG family antitoxin
MVETTTITIRESQAERLHDLKRRGDSYADVVERLLSEHESDAEQSDKHQASG